MQLDPAPLWIPSTMINRYNDFWYIVTFLKETCFQDGPLVIFSEYNT
jgi:hypothetical protein